MVVKRVGGVQDVIWTILSVSINSVLDTDSV